MKIKTDSRGFNVKRTMVIAVFALALVALLAIVMADNASATPDGTATARISLDAGTADVVNIGDTINIIYFNGVNPATAVTSDMRPYGGSDAEPFTYIDMLNQWELAHVVTDPGAFGIQQAAPVTITITAIDATPPAQTLTPTIMDITDSFSVPVDTLRPTPTVAVSVNPIYTGSLVQTVTVTYDEEMDPTATPLVFMNSGSMYWTKTDIGWSAGNTVFTANFTHAGISESITAETASVQENSAVDLVGNLAYGGTSPSFVVDTYPPLASLNPQGAYWWDDLGLVVAIGHHTIMLGGVDIGTGIDYHEYQINYGGWNMGSTFSITNTGWNIVQYRAVDIAGNVGSTSTTNIYGAEYHTGNVAGAWTDGYAFACNVTVPLGDTLTLQNYTIIMDSTPADTQYFHVYGTLTLLDGDDDNATHIDGSLITNVDPMHYYYLNVYGGTLEMRNSAIEYAGYMDISGGEPSDFENLGVYVEEGTATINGGRFYSPRGVGIIFQGAGSYTMNNHNDTFYRIHDSLVGFALKEADNAVITRTIVEDCTIFGGYINNSMGVDLQYISFTENGDAITTDMGGGLIIVDTPLIVLSHIEFVMNNGPGLIVGNSNLIMHDCVFFENNQLSPDQMAELMMFIDDDTGTLYYAEVYDNIVENTIEHHGMVFNGPIGVTAYRNNITVSAGNVFGLALFYSNESVGRDFVIPDFTVYENDFYGGFGIAYSVEKWNTTIHADVSIGTINVYENNFYTTSFAFWLGQYFEGAADSTLGDLNFIDNTVDGSGSGLYCGERYFYEPQTGANIVFGGITATGNTMDITGHGIYFGIDGVDYFDFGTMTYGDVYVAENDIQIASGRGIHYYGYLWYLDSVTVNIGQMEVARNNLSGTSGSGIYIDIWDIGDIYGTTTIYVGNTWIHNNNVSGFSYNIYYHPDYIGYEVHDFATIYFGDMMIEDNNLGAVAAGGSSIYFRMVDTASYMYDYSAVHIGDIIIRNNVLNDTSLSDNSRGIHANIYENGNYMYDSSTFIMGGVYVYNNSIVADIHGIHFVSYDMGSYMYHDSHVEMGGFYIQDNDVWTRGEYALYYDVYDFGAYMYQNSYFQMDNHEITGNTFNNTAGWTGAYINHWGWGVYMSGQSEAWFGSFIVEGNTFISQSFQYAVFLSYFGGVGYYLYGDAQVHAGDFLFNHNTLDGYTDGLYVNGIGDIGTYTYQNSRVEFGNIEFNHNIIDAVRDAGSWNYGLYVGGLGDLGAYTYGNSQTNMGHFQINHNTVNTTYHWMNSGGIYLSASYIGSYMYDQSSFSMQNLEISHNVIDSYGEGIYYSIEYLAYELYGENTVSFGSFLFNENNITSLGDHGIYADRFIWFGGEIYGPATATMGNLEICDNDIVSVGSGIYAFDLFRHISKNIYANAQVTVGHILINNNVIEADGYGIYAEHFRHQAQNMDYGHFIRGNLEVCNNQINSSWDGIYFYYITHHAYYLYNNAVAEFGDFLFNNNWILSTGDDGMYFSDIEYLGYYMYGNSLAVFGDFLFNNNWIDADSNGIYFSYGFYEIAYFLYGNARVEIGNYEVNDNNITAEWGYGIYWYSYYVGEDLYDYSSFAMGNIEFQRNWIDYSKNDGLCLEFNYYAYGLDGAGVLWEMGDILINHNTVNQSESHGIYVYFHELSYWNYGGTAIFGNISIQHNHVLEAWYDGIYVYMNYFGEGLYEGHHMYMGDILINHNFINTTLGNHGIYIDVYGWGYEIEEGSYIQVGNIEVCNNTIFSDGHGIHWEYFEYMGYNMYDSTFIMGDVLVNNNTIESDSYGIYLTNWYKVAYYMYGSSHMQMGSIQFNDNTIDSLWEGIYFDDLNMNYWAAWMYGQSVFTMGDWLINNNTIIADGDGIYIVPEYFGYYMFGSSRAVFGEFQLMGNDITATNFGIYSWWLYRFGYRMYETSYAEFGTSTIMYNTINTTGYFGISTGPFQFGYQVFDASTVIAGDYIVSNNDITANGYGIEFYVYEVGYNMHDSYFCCHSSSTVTLGDILINDNIIHTDSDWGIYVYYYYVGVEVYYDSSLVVGNLEIRNNDITSYGGICLYMQQIGYDLYGTSSMTLGSTDISGNIIDADGGNGIEVVWEYLAQNIYNHASLIMEDVHVYNNQILNSNDGISLTYRGSPGGIYGFAQVKMPSLYIHENTANSTNYGLRISYYNLHDTFSTATNIDRGIVEIYDCTFTSGRGIYAGSNNMNENKIPFIIRNLEFTNTHGAIGTWGIEATEINHIRVDDCTFNDYDNGVSASEVYLVLVRCTFTGMTGVHAQSSSGGDLLLVDCPTIDVGEMVILHAISSIDIGWILDVRVETLLGHGVPSALVTATGNNSWVVGTDTTGPNGHVHMLVRETRYNQSMYPLPAFNFNAHNFTAQKSVNTGELDWVNVTAMGQSITIIIGDSIPPTIASTHSSDTAGTTGDPFTFRIGASDDMAVQRVMVHYRIGGGAWSTFTMDQRPLIGIMWAQSFNLPHRVGTMEFYFVAWDVGGNPSPASPTFTAPVTDNKSPHSLVDHSPTEAVAGQSFMFEVTAVDNIGITQVQVDYWVDSGTQTTATMTVIEGNYRFEITIPNSLGTLNYRFRVRDAAGNILTSSTFTRTIIDNIPPVVTDNTPASTHTGEIFTFSASATDNLGIAGATVEYWFNGGTHTTTAMSGTGFGPYTLAITIPQDFVGNLSYILRMTDLGGNTAVLQTRNVTVTDSIAPSLISDYSDVIGFAGEEYTFLADATDNIGITSAKVEYRFGTGAFTTTDLILTAGTYSLTISIPSDASGALQYVFIFSDAHGNTLTIPQKTVSIVLDNSQSSVGTGDSMSISMNTFAGGTIEQMNIVYWYGTGVKTNATLSGAWPRTLIVSVPLNSLDSLNYQILLKTAHGWQTSLVREVTVIDDTPPYRIEDASELLAVPGEIFLFSANAYDNIAVSGMKVEYWFNDGAHTTVDMEGEGTGPYAFILPIPADATGDLNYILHAHDAQENVLSTNQRSISVFEEDAMPVTPIRFSDASDGSPVQGKTYTFRTTTTGAVPSSIMVEYWFGSGTKTRVDMEGTGAGPHTLTITIPAGEEGNLQYVFIALDSEGRQFTSGQRTVATTASSEDVPSIASASGFMALFPWILVIILAMLLILLAGKMKAGSKPADESIPPQEADTLVEESQPQESYEDRDMDSEAYDEPPESLDNEEADVGAQEETMEDEPREYSASEDGSFNLDDVMEDSQDSNR